MKLLVPLFKRLSHTIGAIVAAAVVLWTVPAAAAGFFLPTQGVEATARGGATIAPHQPDLDSIWYNPSGLTLLEQQQLSVDVGVVHGLVEHQRAPRRMDDGSWREYEPVQNQAPPMPIPSILAGGPTFLDRVHWAAGVYAPYAISSQYPIDGPQRYVLVDDIGSALGYAHFALGFELSDELSLGIGFQNFMGSFRLVTVGSGYVGMFGDPEDEDLDFPADARITDYFSPTANVGLTYQIHEQVRAGISVQLPHVLHDDDVEIQTHTPEHPAYDGVELSNNRVDISMPFPFYVRAGARYIGDVFDLEAAFIYQHWSIIDEVVITPQDVEATNAPAVDTVPIHPMTVPQEFRNTFSVHLGGEMEMNESLDLRGGYVFERGAVPDHRYSVFALDPDKHQISSGLGYHTDHWTFDLTAAAIIMPSKRIDDSEVRQYNPSDPDDDHAIVVGDGTYDHFGYILGLGTQYRF